MHSYAYVHGDTSADMQELYNRYSLESADQLMSTQISLEEGSGLELRHVCDDSIRASCLRQQEYAGETAPGRRTRDLKIT
jgi:hypothetical protein